MLFRSVQDKCVDYQYDHAAGKDQSNAMTDSFVPHISIICLSFCVPLVIPYIIIYMIFSSFRSSRHATNWLRIIPISNQAPHRLVEAPSHHQAVERT